MQFLNTYTYRKMNKREIITLNAFFALSVSGNLPKGYGEYMKKGCIVLSLPSLVTQY